MYTALAFCDAHRMKICWQTNVHKCDIHINLWRNMHFNAYFSTYLYTSWECKMNCLVKILSVSGSSIINISHKIKICVSFGMGSYEYLSIKFLYSYFIVQYNKKCRDNMYCTCVHETDGKLRLRFWCLQINNLPY